MAPKISSTGACHSASARPASTASSGAVAEITACSVGIGVSTSTSAPKCSGVVMKTGAGAMRPGTAISAARARLAAASPGKTDAAHQVMVAACSGSRTVVSMPYMCVGETEATTGRCKPVPSEPSPKTCAAARLRRSSTPQLLACIVGRPVLPEVTPMMAT